jgi:hypothetical protein
VVEVRWLVQGHVAPVPVDGGWVWVEEVALLLRQKSRLVENSLLAGVAVVVTGIRIARMALMRAIS